MLSPETIVPVRYSDLRRSAMNNGPGETNTTYPALRPHPPHNGARWLFQHSFVCNR